MSFAPWIKIETTTPDKPEIIAMATRLRMKDPDTVTGKLVRLWAWADQNSVDGIGVTVTRAFIDRLVFCKGFAKALESEGWLDGPDGAINFPNFERHNGDSAKRRALETRKKQDQRAGKNRDKSPPDGGTNVPQPSGQKGGPEEELDKGERESVREAHSETLDSEADPLLERVNRLRREWAVSPVLSEDEQRALNANRKALAALALDTWDAMQAYLAAKLPEGSAGWQPQQRIMFLQRPGDVAGRAVAWNEKRAHRTPAPAPKAEPEPGEVIDDPKDALDFFRKADPRKPAA